MKPWKKLLTAVILNSIDPKGIGSDGASPNLALCVPEKEAVGDHLVFMWCLSHKLELALKDAFRDKELDKHKNNFLLNFTCLKNATLKWQFFKNMAK